MLSEHLLPERIVLQVLALWPPRTGFTRPVGAADIIKHSLALLINQACKQLLREPEHKRPGKNLCGRVQRAKARNEPAAHKQYSEKGDDRAHR